MLPDDSDKPKAWRDLADLLPTTALDDHAAEGMVTSDRAELAEVRNAVQMPTPYTVNLPGRRSTVRIRFVNNSDVPLKIKVRLSSPSGKLVFHQRATNRSCWNPECPWRSRSTSRRGRTARPACRSTSSRRTTFPLGSHRAARVPSERPRRRQRDDRRAVRLGAAVVAGALPSHPEKAPRRVRQLPCLNREHQSCPHRHRLGVRSAPSPSPTSWASRSFR